MFAKLRWNKTPELKILKMLAWVIWDEEHLGEDALWVRTKELCPQIFGFITGKRTTLSSICKQTEKQQGLEITPSKLHQRADKTERYGEYNEYVDTVEEAYRAVTEKISV